MSSKTNTGLREGGPYDYPNDQIIRGTFVALPHTVDTDLNIEITLVLPGNALVVGL